MKEERGVANILLTNYCNRNCPYCFAMDKVKVGTDDASDGRTFMDLRDFEYCLNFLQRNRLRVVALLGGEPTLHPNFIEILERCKKDSFFNHIKLFTNGLVSDPIVEYLSNFKGPELHIALNIHHPSDYPTGQWKKIETVLERLGPQIGLGYNIYQTHNDFNYLLKLFLKYRLVPHIRLGLTQPILGVNNAHLALEDFSAVAEEIVAAAENFAQNNLFFSFDCGFPFCMFTLEQHKKLLSCAINFKSLCAPIIDIGPDLSVWRCFPLSCLDNRHLNEFETRMDIEFYYHETFRAYEPLGIYSRCVGCPYRRQGLCTGGCLSRVLREFHGGLKQEGRI